MAVPDSVNSHSMQALQEHLSRLALESSSVSAAGEVLQLLKEPMHPSVRAFFEEQERIAQQPAPELPMRLPRAFYEQADRGAFAGIDSPDWRKRKISIVATEIAYDLFLKELRMPIVETTMRVAPRLLDPKTPPEEIQRIKETHLVKRFPASAVPESALHQCCVVQKKDVSTIVVAVPYTLLSEIAMKFFHYTNEQSGMIAGNCLSGDLLERTKNIMERLFLPEWKCFEAFFESGKSPIVTYRNITAPIGTGLIEVGALDETAQRMLRSDFPPEVTRSLLVDVCKRDPKSAEGSLAIMLLGGSAFLDKHMGW